MNPEKLVGKKVEHIKMGKGVVKEVEDNKLHIEIDGKISKFVYPSCFYKFISTDIKGLKEEIEKDVLEWQTANKIKESEELVKKSKDAFEAMLEREKSREAEKIEKAKADAVRAKFFRNINTSRIVEDDEED